VQARRWPQAEYLFKHALIQEAAYGTLPIERRRELHRSAAEWLEHRHATNLDEVAGLLAGHWAATEDDDRAIAALLRAGDVARREHALDEAVDHYRTLLPLLETRGDRRATALVLLRLGHALHTALRFAESNAAYAEAFDLWEYAPSPPATETLRFAGPPWWQPVDPIRSYSLQDMQLQMALFDRLVERWPDDTLVPSLAERWEVSDDGLRYRFTLREHLVWSDGEPLTAADAAFGVLRNLDIQAPGISVSMLYVIEGARAYLRGDRDDIRHVGVEALDDRTVEFRLTTPAPYLLSMLNRPDCGPQPRHVVERHGDDWHLPQHIVNSGAFRRVEQSADHVVLERRPRYLGSRFGNVARVEWRTGPADHNVRAYLEGELDLVWLGRGWHGSETNRLPADETFPGPPAGLSYLFFNAANRWGANRDVRAALAHGIDRDTLAGALPQDETVATGGVVPPALAGHTPDITPPFDPERGKSLLVGAGFEGPVRVATLERFRPEVEVVAEMWRGHLDVVVEVVVVEDPGLWIALPTSQHDCMVFPGTWYPGYTDPEYFLRLLLASDAADNHGRWSHAPYDALIERAMSAANEQDRLELFHSADRMAVVEQVAVIPLAYAWNTSVRRPSVEGWWEFGKSWANFADLTITRPPG
jgi:oligopeptide transport system substrate-binding protein